MSNEVTATKYPAGMSGNPAPAPFATRMRVKRQLKRRDRETYEPRFELATEGLLRAERVRDHSVADLGTDRLRVRGTP